MSDAIFISYIWRCVWSNYCDVRRMNFTCERGWSGLDREYGLPRRHILWGEGSLRQELSHDMGAQLSACDDARPGSSVMASTCFDELAFAAAPRFLVLNHSRSASSGQLIPAALGSWC